MKFIISATDFAKHPPYPLHSHKSYETFYYISGSGELLYNNQSRFIEKNNITIIPPGIAHSHIKTENLKYISITGNFENKWII